MGGLPFGESLTVLALFGAWAGFIVAAAAFCHRERGFQVSDDHSTPGLSGSTARRCAGVSNQRPDVVLSGGGAENAGES